MVDGEQALKKRPAIKRFIQKIPIYPIFPTGDVTYPYTPLKRGRKDSGPSKMNGRKAG